MPWNVILSVKLAAISEAFCKPECNILPSASVNVWCKRYIAQVPVPLYSKNYGVWRLSVFYSAREDNLDLHGLFFLLSSAVIPKGLTEWSNRRHSLQKENQTSYMDIIKSQNIPKGCKTWLTVLYWNPVEFKVVTSYRHFI